ncbi:hypothetical protein ABU614_06170 [Lysobacter firmicutimachus]|uniref:Lipoprotein n=1 Tax=Lysobacter firmicutimachus TaxID=1792846 RepID=A0AAU8MXC6_9GAMM
MRSIALTAALCAALLAGCAAPEPAKTAEPAAPAADQAGDTGASAVGGERPLGKIGADQVGKLSPVPALKGFGEHWSIQIQATGEMNHRVELTWGSGSEKASGQARYFGQPADAPADLIVLSGELSTVQGAKPMTIEIDRMECIDDGDGRHRNSIRVSVDGMDKLEGCADLAMY